MIRKIEATRDTGHPDECKWETLSESEYDTILEYQELMGWMQVRFSVVQKKGEKLD